jgi:HD-GYP domain-containing protein (c-di-GMP phosphodiesterase class II)
MRTIAARLGRADPTLCINSAVLALRGPGQTMTVPQPQPAQQVRLAELLSALGHALDLTEGQPPGHCVRCCWIGIHIGREIGLGDAEISDLYYTLLLKDLGCSSNAARICQLYLADDLSFKRDFKEIDGSLPQALRFVLAHTGLQAGLAERFRALVNIFQNGGEIARELIDTRCHRGAEIARRMRFSEAVALGIENLDEHWDGRGLPARASGEAIPVYSRIALMAQVIDVFLTAEGADAARREVRHRAGTWFDPRLVAAFERVADRTGFWDALAGGNLQQAIYALEPAQSLRLVDEDYLDDIAEAFAQVIDSKSPYTSGHSSRVTLFSDLIAEELGFTPERRRWLRRAALLHDIGKLGVSNTILDKPGKLDDAEWTAMKMHAAYSETILSRIAAFRELAPVASAHHERLDGKGYPRGLTSEQIVIETRVITTADIFDALTADRPYRPAMPVSQALAIMDDMVGTQLDARCFAALKRSMRRIDAAIAA